MPSPSAPASITSAAVLTTISSGVVSKKLHVEYSAPSGGATPSGYAADVSVYSVSTSDGSSSYVKTLPKQDLGNALSGDYVIPQTSDAINGYLYTINVYAYTGSYASASFSSAKSQAADEISGGINLWFDIADYSSISSSANRTVGSTTAPIVTTLRDKSSQGHFVKTTGTTSDFSGANYGPIYLSTASDLTNLKAYDNVLATTGSWAPAFNYPSLFFNSANVDRVFASGLGATGAPLSFFAVYMNVGQGISFGRYDDGATLIDLRGYYDPFMVNAKGLYTGNDTNVPCRNYGLVIRSSYYNQNTSAYSLNINGTEYHTTEQINGFDTLEIGGYGYRNPPGDNQTDMFLCELIVYNRRVTVSEAKQIEGYLANRWGLTSSLPVGHPYRSSSYQGIIQTTPSLYSSTPGGGGDGGGGGGGGGGGTGDPYVTTFSNIQYKLPAIDAPIRYFQTVADGKLLTINAQLKTMDSSELMTNTIRSLLGLKDKMGAKQYAVLAQKVMQPETLSFFERVSIQHGDERLVMNLWNSKFEVVENTLTTKASCVAREDILQRSGGIYNGYKSQTLCFKFGSTAVHLSVYNSPMVRNGIYVESAAKKNDNGVIVNALSKKDMVLASLSSVEAVVTKDSTRRVVNVETFVDHDGLRTRNIISYH